MTLEGYVQGGRVTTVGITDSVKYEGTDSFERFEYPSKLSEEHQAELSAIAARVMPAFGFECGFFNIEFFVKPDCPPSLVEVNGRIASQFAPLVQELHGRSTYDALFQLACGEDPEWKTGLPEGGDQLLHPRLRGCIRRSRAGTGRGPRDPRHAGAASLRAGRERRPELPARDLLRVRRDEGGGGRALLARARRLNFRLQATAPVR